MVSFLGIGPAGASQVDVVPQSPIGTDIVTKAAAPAESSQTVTGTVEETTEAASDTIVETAEALSETEEAVVEPTVQAVQEASEGLQLSSGSSGEGSVAGSGKETSVGSPGSPTEPASASGDGPRGGVEVSSSGTAGPVSMRRPTAVEASSLPFRQEGEYPPTGDRGASLPHDGQSGSCADGVEVACLLDLLYRGVGAAAEAVGGSLRELASTGLGLMALIGGALLAVAGGVGALRWSARGGREPTTT